MLFKKNKIITIILTISLLLSSVGLSSFDISAAELSINTTFSSDGKAFSNSEEVDGGSLTNTKSDAAEIISSDSDDLSNSDSTNSDDGLGSDFSGSDPSDSNLSEDISEIEEEAVQEAEGSDHAESDEEEEAEDKYEIVNSKTLALQYDDRYSFTESLAGYKFLEMRNEMVTSKVVSMGQVTDDLDQHVVTLKKKSTMLFYATGVGTVDLIFTKEDTVLESASDDASSKPSSENNGSKASSDDASNPDSASKSDTQAAEKIPAVLVHVTVKPAVLTIMYLAGQSNMEGVCGELNYQPKDSIACESGTVYSSFGYKSSSRCKSTTGIAVTNAMSSSNSASFIPESLTSVTSLSGSKLEYPLNTLTAEGGGKTGPDSGLAYEWHRLTGDKVWTVNAGYGGSVIASWIPGANCYERSYRFFKNARQVYLAEIEAGHYMQGEQLFFWQQGEDNSRSEYSDYYEDFLSMYYGLEEVCQWSHFGFITTKSSLDHTTSKSNGMVAPRIAQYYFGGNNGLSNAYVVSNANEKWVTDKSVKSYMNSAYPKGYFTYPLRKGTTIKSLPSQVKDMHPDIHFTQVGHNENGISAAYGMYQIVSGAASSKKPSVTWVNKDGANVTSVSIVKNDSMVLVPVAYPAYTSKNIKVVTPDGVVYSPETGRLTNKTTSSKKVYVKDSAGTILSTLTINKAPDHLDTPCITSLTNKSSGVGIKWGSVKNASTYRIFRKTSSSSWKKIADTSAESYTDTTVVSGKSYFYTIRCVNSSGKSYTSSYNSKGWGITYLSCPEVKIHNASSGISISWKVVKNAKGYYIYRQTGNGRFSKIATTSKNSICRFTDKNAVHGKLYKYKILAYKGSFCSSGQNTVPAMCRLKKPAISSLSNNKSGTVTLKYTKDSTVTGYQYSYVDPVTKNTVTDTISDKTVTSKAIKDLVKGNTYSFQLRTYKKVSGVKYYSPWSSKVSVKITR